MGWMRSVLLAVCLTAVTAVASGASEEPADPWKGTQVLVEVFRVEVNTATLGEADVSAIGQSPEGISIPALLWSLRDEANGRVAAGMKASTCHRKESQTSQSDNYYHKTVQIVGQRDTGPVEQVKWNAYPQEKGLNIFCQVQEGETLYTTCSYDERYVIERSEAAEEDAAAPPQTGRFSWQGTAYAKNGVPMIVAGAQDGEMTQLLVLTATIQRRPEPQPEAAEEAADDPAE